MAKGKFSQPRSGGGENDRPRSDRPLGQPKKNDPAREDGVRRFRRGLEDETAPLPKSMEEAVPESEPDSRFFFDMSDDFPGEFSEDEPDFRASRLSGPEAASPEAAPESLPRGDGFREEDVREEDVREEGSFPEKVLNFLNNHQKGVLVGLCSAAAVLIVGIVLVFVLGGSSGSDPYGNRILGNVTVAGVNVGGMTRSEAVQAVKRATRDTFTKQDMVIRLPEETISLSPEKTGAELDVTGAVDAAFAYGRTGSKEQQQKDYQASLTGNHTIGLLPYLRLDEDYIHSELNAFAEKYAGVFTQSGYTLEGERPSLTADGYDPSAPGQTLVLTVGVPGLGLDLDELYDRILDAYSLNEFLVEVKDVSVASTPEPLDLDAIYEEVSVAPVEASVDENTYESIPGSYGYGFDLEKAKQLLTDSQYGDTLRIPMDYIAPEALESAYFTDVLGSCQTPHTSNENRNTNLRLACQALNGVILEPGETFSYNETLGKRTAEKGYKKAPAYSGDELVDTIGGGICQGSSTLYYCALLADMEIVDRINHGFPASYIDKGMDATVSWGGPDFKFKNNTNYPVKILAEVSDGYVKMKIMGTEERDYYIKMEYEVTGTREPDTVYEEHGPDEGYTDGQVLKEGTTGIYVKTYKCKYNRETDKLISRDFETRSSYRTVNKVVVRIVGGETEPPTTEPPVTEPPVTEPPVTEPPVTDPDTGGGDQGGGDQGGGDQGGEP